MPLNKDTCEWYGAALKDLTKKYRDTDEQAARLFERLNVELSEVFRQLREALQFLDDVTSFASHIAVTRQITKTIVGSTVSLGHSLALAEDASLQHLTHFAEYDSGTTVLTLTPKTEKQDAEGHAISVTSGTAITINLGNIAGTGTGSKPDVQNDTVVAVAGPDFLRIPSTRGTSSIFEWVAAGTGASFVFKSGATSGQVLQFNGTAWGFATITTAITLKNSGVSAGATNIIDIPAASNNALIFGAGTLGFAAGGYGMVPIFDGSIWTIDYPVEGDMVWIDFNAKVIGHIGPSEQFFSLTVEGSDNWIIGDGVEMEFDERGHKLLPGATAYTLHHAIPQTPTQAITIIGSGACYILRFDEKGHIPSVTVITPSGTTTHYADGTTDS